MKPEQIEIERARFETWYTDQHEWPQAVERRDDGGYKMMAASVACRVWQAANAAPPPDPMSDAKIRHMLDGMSSYCGEWEAAIVRETEKHHGIVRFAPTPGAE